jgi:hypothetical protein
MVLEPTGCWLLPGRMDGQVNHSIGGIRPL